MSLSKETLVLLCCHSVLTVVNFPSALAAVLVSKPYHEAFTHLDTQHFTYLQQQEESLGLYQSSHPMCVANYPVSLSLFGFIIIFILIQAHFYGLWSTCSLFEVLWHKGSVFLLLLTCCSTVLSIHAVFQFILKIFKSSHIQINVLDHKGAVQFKQLSDVKNK